MEVKSLQKVVPEELVKSIAKKAEEEVKALSKSRSDTKVLRETAPFVIEWLYTSGEFGELFGNCDILAPYKEYRNTTGKKRIEGLAYLHNIIIKSRKFKEMENADSETAALVAGIGGELLQPFSELLTFASKELWVKAKQEAVALVISLCKNPLTEETCFSLLDEYYYLGTPDAFETLNILQKLAVRYKILDSYDDLVYHKVMLGANAEEDLEYVFRREVEGLMVEKEEEWLNEGLADEEITGDLEVVMKDLFVAIVKHDGIKLDADEGDPLKELERLYMESTFMTLVESRVPSVQDHLWWLIEERRPMLYDAINLIKSTLDNMQDIDAEYIVSVYKDAELDRAFEVEQQLIDCAEVVMWNFSEAEVINIANQLTTPEGFEMIAGAIPCIDSVVEEYGTTKARRETVRKELIKAFNIVCVDIVENASCK